MYRITVTLEFNYEPTEEDRNVVQETGVSMDDHVAKKVKDNPKQLVAHVANILAKPKVVDDGGNGN